MKTLLATVAVGALVGTAGIAQEAADSALYSVAEGDYYASNLLGSRLYTTEAEVGEDADFASVSADWNDVGEINDVVVGQDGSVRAVIVGVGGFLGIGEKDVAISWEDVSPTYDETGSRFLVVSMSQEALETAPAFEYEELDASVGEGAGMAEGEGAATDQAATTEMAEGEIATDEAAATELAEGEAVAEETDAEAMAEADVTEASEAATDVAEAEVVDQDAQSTETALADGEVSDDIAAVQPAEGAEIEGVADPMAEDLELVQVDMLTAEELEGATVRSAGDEEWVGEVSSLILDDEGKITEAVIDVGGFLGIGEKPVAMGFDQLEIYRQGEGGALEIKVNASREELEGMEGYQPDEG